MRTTKLGFPDFVHRVEVSLTQSKTYWDNHWRPQSDFIDDNIDSVMRIENLDKDFGEFAAGHDLGFTENIPIFGQSKYGKFPQLSVNEESLDRVRRIYEKDFEAFGYPLEPPTLK